MKRCLGTLLLTMMTLCAFPVLSHTTLQSTSPASGSVVPASPGQVTLVFNEPTRLTAVVVVTPAGERRLRFAPTGSATSFVVTAPELVKGRNELRWRALSRDGHPVEGSIIIVVRPPKP
jgi:methionine-rich copper-binding protein CopC